MKIVHSIIVCACSMFFCSCATQDSLRLPFSTETSFNSEAGRGGVLLVTLRSEGGEGLLFLLDTGSPFCLFDKSLEPMLGKPSGDYTIHSLYGATHTKLYQSPKLYLNNVQLKIGATVTTMDCKQISDDLNHMTHSDYRIMGVLGMECLRYYCIQLDFNNKKLRLLDPNHLENKDLGRAFPLVISRGSGPYVSVHGNLANLHGTSSIDSGMTFDGDVEQKQFPKQRAQHYLPKNMVFKNGTFGGCAYTNLDLGDGRANVLGLGFLSRNLVTFNFPKRMLYLKQTSIGPLPEETVPTNASSVLTH